MAILRKCFTVNVIEMIADILGDTDKGLTGSEKNEHEGFCSLLKGLCSMFRNPTAHEPKVDLEISEQDALEILGIISYCHRRLDNYQKIR